VDGGAGLSLNCDGGVDEFGVGVTKRRLVR